MIITLDEYTMAGIPERKEMFTEYLKLKESEDGYKRKYYPTILETNDSIKKAVEKVKNQTNLYEITDPSSVNSIFGQVKKDEKDKSGKNRLSSPVNIYREFLDRLKSGPINTNPQTKYQEYIALLEEARNLVLTGAPGTGKTFLAKEIVKAMGAETDFVQFHPSYDYTDFVEGLRPLQKDGGEMGFERKDGIFKEFCKKALKNLEDSQKTPDEIDEPYLTSNFVKKKKYVFIIDEVNRGEISKIFGELFFSIDPGYRGEKGRVKTQYQNLISEDDVFYDGFFVPENVYILATMNDIDRSVESMDFAMRRRFTWKEITPDNRAEMLDTLACGKEAKATMNRLNDVIAETEGLGAAYMVGPSYFLKLENGGDFNKLWKMNIEPLLKEYLRGFHKAGDILGKLKKAYFNNNEESGSGSDLLDED